MEYLNEHSVSSERDDFKGDKIELFGVTFEE